MDIDFRSFASIERLEGPITIWEKIDGSNSQIFIDGDKFLIGSRNKWITPDDDNFGFAKWSYENKYALVSILGQGRHFGEWWGSGIQRKYDLKEKRLSLFDNRFKEKESSFIPGLFLCPVLYEGIYKEGIIGSTLEKLKTEGSAAAPGFMRPEGIVVRFHRNGALFKKTFEDMDLPRLPKKDRPVMIDVSPYLQIARLQSVLSKDENLTRNYPNSIVDISKLYVNDLIKESFDSIPESVLKAIKQQLFRWIKSSECFNSK